MTVTRLWSMSVFTLLSIKTRIETCLTPPQLQVLQLFLLYYPLKQGLKRVFRGIYSPPSLRFLLYYPLKQGLKLFARNSLEGCSSSFYSTIH